MKILKDKAPKKIKRLIGIDASTRNIGMSVIEDGKIVKVSWLNLPRGDIIERLGKIRRWFPAMLRLYEPDMVLIEEPVYIQNPQSTKHISFAVGIIYAECIIRDIIIKDVAPSQWKSYMGYKIMTKKRQEEIVSRLGETEGRKEIQRLRKSQIQDKMREKYPHFSWEDDNVADAGGISLYGWHLYG